MTDNMPVFTIKAKDVLAIKVIEFYAECCRDLGLTQQVAEVKYARTEMAIWRGMNPELIKAPTHKHVDVTH